MKNVTRLLIDGYALSFLFLPFPHFLGVAEWDFGGFPPWLLAKEPAIRIRSSDAAFLDLVSFLVYILHQMKSCLIWHIKLSKWLFFHTINYVKIYGVTKTTKCNRTRKYKKEQGRDALRFIQIISNKSMFPGMSV